MDAESSKRLVLLNIPNIHKPMKINGHLVVGFLYLNKNNLTYPKYLIKDLNRVANGYKIDIYDSDPEEEYESAESRFDSIKNKFRKEKNINYVKNQLKI